MKKIIRKVSIFLKSLLIKIKYKTNSNVKILGKVDLDNKNIHFGNGVILYENVQIWGNGIVKLGNNVAIGRNTIIFSNEEVVIEDDTIIAGNCYIIDSDHGIEKNKKIVNQELVSKRIYIGSDVWIGSGVQILKGSNIANGCVIGAGSVFISKIQSKDYEIYAGVPAKKISERKEENK